MSEERVVVGRSRREGLQRGIRKLLKVMDMFVIFTLAVVSQVYTYVKI